MNIANFVCELGLSQEDVLKLGVKIREWQRDNLSDLEIKENVIRECVRMSNKDRDFIKEEVLHSEDIEIVDESTEGWMEQPVSLVVNKYENEGLVEFLFPDEQEFFMSKLKNNEDIIDLEVWSEVYYEFDKDTGELYLVGEGNMPNYQWDHDYVPAWYNTLSNKIKSVVVDEGITSVGCGVFQYLPNLLSVKLPNTIKKIYNGAFVGCKSLESINIPESVVDIDVMAFSGCDSLKSINIPESVVHIDSWAFSECQSLEEIKLPKGLKDICPSAFENCENLKKIYMSRETFIGIYYNPEEYDLEESDLESKNTFDNCDAEIIYID